MQRLIKRIGAILCIMVILGSITATTNTSIKIAGHQIGIVNAYATDLDKALDDMKNTSGTVVGTGVKTKISTLGKDGMDIVGIVVMAVLVISGLLTALKFSRAGDNPQAKTALKGVLILDICGIIFLANYFGLVKFVFKSINLFP